MMKGDCGNATADTTRSICDIDLFNLSDGLLEILLFVGVSWLASAFK